MTVFIYKCIIVLLLSYFHRIFIFRGLCRASAQEFILRSSAVWKGDSDIDEVVLS